MGYYTHFKLEVSTPNQKELEQFKEDFRNEGTAKKLPIEISPYNIEYITDIYYENADSAKWYSYQDDMNKVSKYYPNILFKLSGEGEEAGDIWVMYFKNGKSQYCKAQIIIPPYDETKME